jgi:hypothetical protein
MTQVARRRSLQSALAARMDEIDGIITTGYNRRSPPPRS